MKTHEKLIQAAATLLDTGGEHAVTLRAVGHASGVSHNAPYKHFKNRNALLAAVAAADLKSLTAIFVEIRESARPPKDKLLTAIGTLIKYSRERPSRYRLVFGAPTLAQEDNELQAQGNACLAEIMAMVDECKRTNELPDAPTKSVASLLLAAMHGLITLEANGQIHPEKGLPTIEDNMDLMVSLFSR